MIRTTTFDRHLWKLTTFDTISYQKNEQILIIYCFDGSTLEFHSITEEHIFQLILATNKETFVNKNLQPYLAVTNKQDGCPI